MQFGITTGHKYKTKGGWTAFIMTFIDENPIGYLIDCLGHKEPFTCAWNVDTGKCIKHGDFTAKEIVTPYDIIGECTDGKGRCN